MSSESPKAPPHVDLAFLKLSPRPEDLEPLLDVSDKEARHTLTAHFHRAVLDGNPELLTWFLNHKEATQAIDINAFDNDGHTPLVNAVALGHSDTARLLVHHGADVNCPDSAGWTALHWAVQSNDLSLTSYLLNHRASPLVATQKGLRPSDLIARGIDGLPVRQLLKGAEIVLEQERADMAPKEEETTTSSNTLRTPHKTLRKKTSSLSLISEASRTTNSSLASSLAPSVILQIEEEIREREMRRRIDLALKASDDLDIDLSILGLGSTGLAIKERGKSLTLELEDQLSQSPFTWDKCLPHEMLVYAPEQVPALLSILITDMKPYRLRSERVIPVNALFLCIRYAVHFCTQDMVDDLIIGILERVEDSIHDSPNNTQLCLFWLSNMILLLYYLKRDQAVSNATDKPLKDETLTTPEQEQSLQSHIADLINDILVFVIRNAERKVDRLLEDAVLEFEPLPGQLDDIDFQGWAGSKFVKKLMGSAKKTVDQTKAVSMKNLFSSYVSSITTGSPVALTRDSLGKAASPSHPESPTKNRNDATPSRLREQSAPELYQSPKRRGDLDQDSSNLSPPRPRRTPVKLVGAYPGPETPGSNATLRTTSTITSLQNEYTPSTIRSTTAGAGRYFHPNESLQEEKLTQHLSLSAPDRLLSVLSSTLFLFQIYEVAPVIIVQAFSQLFYWMGSELFNAILTHKRYLCRSRALQILLNVSVVEDWVKRSRLPLEIVKTYFRPVNELLRWISCFSTEKTVDDLIGSIKGLKTLNPLQLRRVVRNYRYEVGEERLESECELYLEQLCSQWEDVQRGGFKPLGLLNREQQQEEENLEVYIDRVDNMLLHSGTLQKYKPPRPRDCTGECLDPKYMLPFVIPSDLRHAVIEDKEDVFLFGQTVTLETTVREMSQGVSEGEDMVPRVVLEDYVKSQKRHERSNSVASVSSLSSMSTTPSENDTTITTTPQYDTSCAPLGVDISEDAFSPVLTPDFFRILDMARLSAESGGSILPRRNKPLPRSPSVSFTDLHGIGLGMLPFSTFARPKKEEVELKEGVLSNDKVEKDVARHVESMAAREKTAPHEYEPDRHWVMQMSQIESDCGFDYTLPQVLQSEDESERVLGDLTNTYEKDEEAEYDDLTPRLPSAFGFVTV